MPAALDYPEYSERETPRYEKTTIMLTNQSPEILLKIVPTKKGKKSKQNTDTQITKNIERKKILTKDMDKKSAKKTSKKKSSPEKDNFSAFLEPKVKKTKGPKTSEVVYPVLIECSELVVDEFWAQFYRDLAVGKGSRGVFISNGIIQTTSKRNGFTYSITDKAPEIMIDELHTLLNSKTSICSSKDLLRRKRIVQEIEKEFELYDEGKWSSVKRKNIKQMLLLEWVLALRQKHNLSWKVAEEAYRTVTTAFDFKTHNSHDVKYAKGSIIDIDDLVIRNGHLVNEREICDKIDKSSTNKGIELQSHFDSYVTALAKSLYLK